MSIATISLLVAGWLAGWLLAGRRVRLTPAAGTGRGDRSEATRVSVVVPARNEAERLPQLLSCLAALDPAPHEVLVVDDESTDATAELAAAAGARVLAVSPPPGWTGKAWACHRGAEEATGDVLVFLDADTEPAPGAIGALAGAAQEGALVSAHPRHRVERAYEHLSAGPAVVTTLGGGLGGTPRHRWWRRPIAFGPAIAVRRDVYEHIGGHASVCSDVAEDLALARVADRAGVPVRSLLGGPLLTYRMYPEGVGSLLEGWSKNLAVGAGATPPVRLAATVTWVSAGLQAGVSLATLAGWPAVVAYLAFAAQFAVLAGRVGRFGPVTPLAFPLVLAGFVLLFVRSTALVLHRRSVPWRGRQVAVRA